MMVGMWMPAVQVVAIVQAVGEQTMGRVMHASGTFTVKTVPQEDAIQAGRLTLEKSFTGALVGESKGQMLSAMGTVKGSGSYVAIETFTGTLDGKKGSFALAHSGTMQGGKFVLHVSVVPDSGTGELVGLTGTMTIDPTKGHAYVFEYTLP